MKNEQESGCEKRPQALMQPDAWPIVLSAEHRRIVRRMALRHRAWLPTYIDVEDLEQEIIVQLLLHPHYLSLTLPPFAFIVGKIARHRCIHARRWSLKKGTRTRTFALAAANPTQLEAMAINGKWEAREGASVEDLVAAHEVYALLQEHLTLAEQALLEEFYDARMGAAGMHTKAAAALHQKCLHLCGESAPRPLQREQRNAMIKRLYQEGHYMSAIARLAGVTDNAVRVVLGLRESSWKLGKARRAAALEKGK